MDNRPLASALLALLALFAACSTPKAPDGTPTRRGPTVTVIDELGDPVEGAEVWIADPTSLRADVAVVASRVSGDWVETAKAVAASLDTTDANGKVRFPVAPLGGVLVAASKGSQFAALERRQIGASGLELTLRPRVQYRVEVVDHEGAPAPDVAVSLAIPRGESLERIPASARTDATGIATLVEPPPEAFAARRNVARGTVRVALARIPAAVLPSASVDPVGTGRIELPPTGAVTLIASHSQYEEDHWECVVQLFSASSGTRSEQTLARELKAGRAEYPYVEVGVDLRVVGVFAEATDEQQRPVGSYSERLEPVVEIGESRGRVMVLDRGALLQGTVVDANGEPVPGVPVTLRIKDAPATTWVVVSDLSGGFRWLVTQPRTRLDGALVEVRAAGREGTKTLPETPAGSTIDLGPIEVL